MKMKARPHLHYAPVPDGVYFSGARAQFVMRGPELLFTIADVCVSLLEEGATEDELVAALRSERARPAVRHLCAELRKHGMLLNLERLTVAEPPPDVRQRHPESLAHLESLSEDPYATFARLRESKVLLCGPSRAVLPAARGLARAGVGRLILATSDPDDAAATAHRLGADVVPLSREALARVGGDVQGALYCCGQGAEDDEEFVLVRQDDWLPQGVPLVPLWLDDQVVLVGPALVDASERNTWQPLRDRAQAWAHAEADAPVPRPIADALAGALAGQMLFELLTEGSVTGEVHVVHGGDLVADRIVVARRGQVDDQWCSLDDAESMPTPEGAEALSSINAISQPWTGLFTLASGDDLPQLPLALREVEYRGATAGAVIAWGPDQQAATVHAGLEALRGLSATSGVGAAGLTEERWLLDGALRLLAEGAEPLDQIHLADLEPEAVQILRGLEALEPGAITVRLLNVPGLDWRLARIDRASTDETLGLGWGRDGAEAVRAALGAALGRAQTRELRGLDLLGPGPNTDSLTFADDSAIASLRKAVSSCAAAEGVIHRGRPERADDVLGLVPLWWGPVEAYRLSTGSTNA